MKIVGHTSCCCSVERRDEELWADSIFLSTGFEVAARIQADVRSFEIKSARWDAFRTPEGFINLGQELPELKGVEAFVYSGKMLRQAVGEEMDGLAHELIAECIRGVVQSEAYLIHERGYESAKHYDSYWDKAALDTCRYYNNLDRISVRWGDYLGGHSRVSNLFNRNKLCTIYRQSEGGVIATGDFIDTFHEIGLVLTLSSDGVVADCSGQFIRGPDPVCYENTELLSNLVGKNLIKMTKKEMAVYFGGAKGCPHVMEILSDLRRALANAINRENSKA